MLILYLANEAAERLSAFTVSASLLLYLTKEMKESLPDAATHVSDWVGATYLLMLLGAFLADAYLGRYLTVILSSAVYLVVSSAYLVVFNLVITTSEINAYVNETVEDHK